MAKSPISPQSTLCLTFASQAAKIWNILTAAQLMGLVHDEETVTNNLLMEIQQAHPADVITVQFRKPEEKFTGADWEWWLSDGQSWFGLLIQAKRLGSVTHKYGSIKHRVGKERTPQNFGAYGHEIRNLLILACTEVEAQCKNIMAANGVVKTWGTKAYAKLAPAMKLGEYRVTLNWYPWLDPIAPFLGWEPGEMSTQSLRWYHAYNQVKHDRENYFSMATLQNALLAVTGSFVMLCAQYGWDFALRDKEGERAFFQLTGTPTWPAEEIYVPGELQPVHYFSGTTGDEIPNQDELS